MEMVRKTIELKDRIFLILSLLILLPPELLFPVCNPKPGKGESCLSQPNLLMDMLAWDQEGPRDHCPCADDLRCQPHG